VGKNIWFLYGVFYFIYYYLEYVVETFQNIIWRKNVNSKNGNSGVFCMLLVWVRRKGAEKRISTPRKNT
jgi:hypothetical protein